ncbi:MAG: hypothetical protein ACRYG7_46250 [Janthinobacterium lividum]
MSDFSTAFHSLGDGFQKKLGDLVAVAIWAGAGLVGKFAWDLVRQWQTARRQQKQSNPVYLAEKQIRLDVAADRACVWAEAAHVSIYQFSNGSYFSNGDSIQKISMAGEAVDSNLVRRWRLESQNLPTSAFPYLMRGIQSGRLWLYRDECEDYELNRLMRERGYATAVAALLQGQKGTWLGVLVMAWGEGRRDETELDLCRFEDHRRACAFILAEQ